MLEPDWQSQPACTVQVAVAVASDVGTCQKVGSGKTGPEAARFSSGILPSFLVGKPEPGISGFDSASSSKLTPET